MPGNAGCGGIPARRGENCMPERVWKRVNQVVEVARAAIAKLLEFLVIKKEKPARACVPYVCHHWAGAQAVRWGWPEWSEWVVMSERCGARGISLVGLHARFTHVLCAMEISWEILREEMI